MFLNQYIYLPQHLRLFLFEEMLSPRGEEQGSKRLVPTLEKDFHNALFRVAFFSSKHVGTHSGSKAPPPSRPCPTYPERDRQRSFGLPFLFFTGAPFITFYFMCLFLHNENKPI